MTEFNVNERLIEKHTNAVHNDPAWARLTRPRWVPYTDTYIRERETFVRQWEALTEYGEKEHYLEWTEGYSEARLEPATNLGYYDGTEAAETTQQWEVRLNKEIQRRVNADLQRLKKILADLDI